MGVGEASDGGGCACWRVAGHRAVGWAWTCALCGLNPESVQSALNKCMSTSAGLSPVIYNYQNSSGNAQLCTVDQIQYIASVPRLTRQSVHERQSVPVRRRPPLKSDLLPSLSSVPSGGREQGSARYAPRWAGERTTGNPRCVHQRRRENSTNQKAGSDSMCTASMKNQKMPWWGTARSRSVLRAMTPSRGR